MNEKQELEEITKLASKIQPLLDGRDVYIVGSVLSNLLVMFIANLPSSPKDQNEGLESLFNDARTHLKEVNKMQVSH